MARKRRATRTITPKRKGQKRLTFKQGALRAQLGTTKKGTIPKGKLDAAAKGRYGPKAQKRALFAKNVLKAGRRRKGR